MCCKLSDSPSRNAVAQHEQAAIRIARPEAVVAGLLTVRA